MCGHETECGQEISGNVRWMPTAEGHQPFKIVSGNDLRNLSGMSGALLLFTCDKTPSSLHIKYFSWNLKVAQDLVIA